MITAKDSVLTKELLNFFRKNTNYRIYTTSRKKNKKKNNYYLDLKKKIKIKNNFDLLIHCAFNHPFTKSKKNKKQLAKENVLMSENIHKFMKEKKIAKLVFLSSIAAYGVITGKELSEKYKSKNENWYGISKKQSEKIFLNTKNKYECICLRVPGIFVPNLSTNNPLIISVIRKLIFNKKIELYNRNGYFNNITDAYDIFRVIKIFLKSRKNLTGFYNLAASRPIKVYNLISFLKKKFNSESCIIFKKFKKNPFLISIEKIQSMFKFKASSTREILLRNTEKLLLK